MRRWCIAAPSPSPFPHKRKASMVTTTVMEDDGHTKHRLRDSLSYRCRQKVALQCWLAWGRRSLSHSQRCHFRSAASASWGQIDALLGVKHTSCLKVCCSELQRQALSMLVTRLIRKVQISVLWNNRGNCAMQIINQNASNARNLCRGAVDDDGTPIMMEHCSVNWYQDGLKKETVFTLAGCLCHRHRKKAGEFWGGICQNFLTRGHTKIYHTVTNAPCSRNHDASRWIVIKAKPCFTEELEGI